MASSTILERLCERHYGAAVVLVLALAAFNLSFRLNREVVTEWDEALYAMSAAETATHGNWIATTLDGQLDYYNTKPPLNVWLIATSFKIFGIHIWSLRFPSAIAAWLTVAALTLWTGHAFRRSVGLLAGVVLSTTFGFLYVHAGKSANTDALFTLLILLCVITLAQAENRPWTLAWLGPLVAGVFLLRGLAVLMPLVLIGSVTLIGRPRGRGRIAPLLVAAGVAAAAICGWLWARWRLDGWAFVERMVQYDFIARTTEALEGHTGTALYYLNVLQKDQYDWLVAAALSLVVFPLTAQELRQRIVQPPSRYLRTVLGCWGTVTLLIPTVMQTKVAWYLNPFFPLFALTVGAALSRGLTCGAPGLRRRRQILAGAFLLAFAVAQAKLVWYSFHMRDLTGSAQGVLLDARDELKSHGVFKHQWPRAERFVATYVVGAEVRDVQDIADFLRRASSSDFMVLSRREAESSALKCVAQNRNYSLCRAASAVRQ